jgi:phage gp29-like protein
MAIRILDYQVSAKGIVNIGAKERAYQEQRKESQKAMNRVFQMAITRTKKGMNDWKTATMSAESIQNPNNAYLQDLYSDIDVDAHLFALMQTVKLKTLANSFAIQDENGENVDELSELFRKKWFRRLVGFAIDSKFYGFSAVQLGDIKNGIFADATLIPRRYVLQQKGGIKTSLNDSRNLMLFDADPWLNWIVPIGEKEDLGLLHKAAPLVIKKKEVIAAWSEAAEIFGMPFRLGKTNISSPENRDNMEDMLENMGTAAWGVFDVEDDIQFVETAKTDFYNIYDKFIDRANSELSKLVLLQTGTTDEKAFAGSADVHATILGSLIESMVLFIEEVANEQVIPLMQKHGLLPLGVHYRAVNEQKLSTKELFDVVKELLKTFDISAEWIEETFEVPVEEKQTPTSLLGQDPRKVLTDPDASPEDTLKAIENIYKDYFSGLKCC